MKKELNRIKYNYIDPSGNITILVESEITATEQSEVAKRMMDAEPECEQVGFVRKSSQRVRLRMAGGEFCGNAVMSAAALLCDDTALNVNETRSVTVESSGADDPIQVDITRLENEDDLHIFRGKVDMPLPRRVTSKKLSFNGAEYELPVVEFEGIAHIICMPQVLLLTQEETEQALRSWIDNFNTECIGIMLISSVDDKSCKEQGGCSEIEMSVRPLVYVPAVDTCVWERSCASGTTAIGAYYSDIRPGADINITAHEPGGTLAVSVTEGHLYLNGSVKI